MTNSEVLEHKFKVLRKAETEIYSLKYGICSVLLENGIQICVKMRKFREFAENTHAC